MLKKILLTISSVICPSQSDYIYTNISWVIEIQLRKNFIKNTYVENLEHRPVSKSKSIEIVPVLDHSGTNVLKPCLSEGSNLDFTS